MKRETVLFKKTNTQHTTHLFFPTFFFILAMIPLLLSAQSPESLEAGLKHLENTRAEYQLSQKDIENPKVTDHYVSKHNQLTHLYLKQTYEGIEVFNTSVNMAILRNYKVVSSHISLIADLENKINTTTATISAIEAVEYATRNLNISLNQELKTEGTPEGAEQKTIIIDENISREEIPIKLVYFLTKDGAVKLAWDLSILEVNSTDWWSMRIDATSGMILEKTNWTVHCTWNTAHDHNHAQCPSNQNTTQKVANTNPPLLTAANPIVAPNSYNVYAAPIESPNHGVRSIVTTPWLLDGGVASPFGWHDTNGAAGAEYTITRGNNVHAMEDRDGNNGTGASPNGTASLDFDYPINFAAGPASYTDAATTNLFYWNNLVHDVWYQYGFDEASGNFQSNNYGNGGLANDYVIADCQDGSGINNANFSSPPDGSNGRMQMFEWGSSATVTFNVNSPGGVAGGYFALPAGFGPALPTAPANITANLVIVDDGTAAPTEGCNALINAAAVNGNIALVDRANCNFTDKVKNAQNAGAVACLVCDNGGGIITMGGTDNTITIPSIMISQADCATIRAAIPTVNVSMSITGTSNNIDGDFDNGIIAHEYGHGISIRLTGGAANAGCLGNEEQMGEGWSDWFGLMMTIENGDLPGDSRGIGTYAVSQPTSGNGIRPAPYSTNTAVNDYTYGDLCNGEVTVPHGVGFVWSTMLWDLSWAFINQYGFDPDIHTGTGGNNMVMQLVIDGLKLQPCSPGFVDGRDAILLADQMNNGGANQCLIWNTFAARGLGYSADQGVSTNRCDGTEAFDLSPECSNVITFAKTADSDEVLDNGIIRYTLTASNYTANTEAVVLSDNLPPNTAFVAGSSPCGATVNGNTITFNSISIPAGQSGSCSFDVQVNSPIATTFTFYDDMESGNANWNSTTLNATYPTIWVNSTTAYSGTNAWYAENIATQSDQALTMINAYPVSGANPELRFYHSYNTETSWDGGVVEYTVNGGTTWADMGSYMIQNGYNNGIQVNQASAISGRQAFTGNSNGYLETVADLTNFVGQNISVRFRFASDGFVGEDGWYVDDVRIIDAINMDNIGCASTTQGLLCDTVTTLIIGSTCNAVADILEHCDGQTAILDATNSTGIGITYSWTALNGGNITSGATTSMPEVNADGTYVLTITGTDGCVDTDTLELLIDPAALNLVGQLPYTSSLNDIWGYTDVNGNEFALLGLQDGVSIVDIATDPPTEIHRIAGVSTTWRDLKTWGNYAYVINEAPNGGGLLIIDLTGLTTNPLTSTIVTYTRDFGVGYTDCHNIFIDENGAGYLFGATCSANPPGQTTNRGTLFIDIASNPTNPAYLGMYPQNIIGSNDTYIHDGFVRGDTMWASHIYGGTFGVIDVSNKAGTFSTTNGTILALQPTPGNFTHACWLTDDGNTLAVVDETGGNNGLGINTYDVSNLNNIIHLDNIQSKPGTNVVPHNVFIKGDFVVASYYTSGVVIVDISDPSNTVIVEDYDTSPNSGNGFAGCWGTYPFFPSGTIIASDRQQGLFVFEAECQYASRIEGTVTDQTTGQPIIGATIDVLNYIDEETTSNVLGFYSTGIPYCGTYDVVFSAPCYESDTIPVNFENGIIVTLDVDLVYNCCVTQGDAGDMVQPSGLTQVIEICEGDDIGAFNVSYLALDESTPGTGFDYNFILTNEVSPYTILDFNTTGDFDFSVLTAGDYYIWGLSYSTTNTPTSGTAYLGGASTITQIQQDIANGVCADVEGAYANGNTAIVTINNLPTAPTITANSATTFCQGGSVTLISSIGTSYLWSTGATSQSITVSITGNYTVQVIDGNGCLSAPSPIEFVKVNPLPSQPTITANGPTSFCLGGTVTLSSSVGINHSYLWSNGATTQSILVNTSGNYSVQVTDNNGCTSIASAPVTVTANVPPAAPSITANGPLTFCQGDNVTLTSSFGSGYLWSNGMTTPSITVNTSGNYSVQITDANGCTSNNSATSNVFVNALPNANFNGLGSNYCGVDNPVTLVPTTTGGTFSGVGVSGNTFDPSLVPSSMWGSPVTIQYTVSVNGCQSTSTAQTTVNTCVVPGLNLSVKVLLEGAQNGLSPLMHTKLRQDNLIPINQPYNTAPWNYAGTESVASVSAFPSNMVDWVLVELREGTPSATGAKGTTIIEMQAGILLENGNIVGTDGVSDLVFNSLSLGIDYHVLIRHRNHLDIISNSTVTASTNMVYDFTSSVATAFGGQQLKLMPNGLYAMYAADYTIDGVIQITDFSEWKIQPSILFTYFVTDGNMDGVVQTTDYDIWVPNKAKLGPAEISLP